MKKTLFTYKTAVIYFMYLLLLIFVGWWISAFLKSPQSLIDKNPEPVSTYNIKNPREMQRIILKKIDIQLLRKYLLENKMFPVASPEITAEERKKQTERYFNDKIHFLFLLPYLKNQEFDKVLALYYYGDNLPQNGIAIDHKKTCAMAFSALFNDYNRITGQQIPNPDDSEIEVFFDVEDHNRILAQENVKQKNEIPAMLKGYVPFHKSEKFNCFFPYDSPTYIRNILYIIDYDETIKYPNY